MAEKIYNLNKYHYNLQGINLSLRVNSLVSYFTIAIIFYLFIYFVYKNVLCNKTHMHDFFCWPVVLEFWIHIKFGCKKKKMLSVVLTLLLPEMATLL